MNMIEIPGGAFLMGTNSQEGSPSDLEGPATKVELPGFLMDETTVTNADFREFVEETGYTTESETFGWSFVFHLLLSREMLDLNPVVPGTKWWRGVSGADWRHPEGPGSTIEDRWDHPVVHISRNDALAYCKWAGKRLPTEAEWEYAARGGLEEKRYPWGDDLMEGGVFHCNIWQGNFPLENSLEDGYLATAPGKTFEPNGYGLYQMVGNVWEWCVNPQHIPLEQFTLSTGKEFWEQHQRNTEGNYAIRGGSFLCHQSYCKRYRVAARNGNTADSASSNMGFRCVRDLGE